MSTEYRPDSREHAALLEANGREVAMPGGNVSKIYSHTYEAIYPYRHMVITVSLEMVDKECEEYRETRRALKGDWLSDYFGSSIDFQLHVLNQIGFSYETRDVYTGEDKRVRPAYKPPQ